jgi:hypothetical protein
MKYVWYPKKLTVVQGGIERRRAGRCWRDTGLVDRDGRHHLVSLKDNSDGVSVLPEEMEAVTGDDLAALNNYYGELIKEEDHVDTIPRRDNEEPVLEDVAGDQESREDDTPAK